MKKLTRRQKTAWPIIAKRRWQKALRRRDKPHGIPERTVNPPSKLSFRDNYDATIAFLDELRDATLKPGRRREIVYVNLTVVEYISVPVAIVLAAEFQRWQLLKRLKLRMRDADKWNPDVRELLDDLGVFELLGTRAPPRGTASPENFTLTPLQSGLRLDGAKLDRLQARFRDMIVGFTNNATVYEGLSEAVENAIYHAYPEDYVPNHPFAGHRWWGAGCIEVSTMRLRFFVFDQGAGIPHTLPTADIFEGIVTWLAAQFPDTIANDTMMLRAALEVGRTRTLESHRGLGMRRMADVVTGTENAYLRIISRRGEIVYDGDGSIETRTHSSSLGGTLIEWCLPADALTADMETQNERD